MGRPINYDKRAADGLELSIDEVYELAKRMHGHFKKNGFSREQIIKSFFTLRNIKKRKEEQRIKLELPLFGFKHKGISKHRVAIIKLHEQGVSGEQIFKKLKRKKDCPSLSTIKRYIVKYKEHKESIHG